MNQHLLLDIEGTTCPVSFVSEILFPFAKQELSNFIKQNWNNNTQNRAIQDANKEWSVDQSIESLLLKKQADRQQVHEADGLIKYLKHMISIDKKSTALKDLQGKIWEYGYRNGELKAELFPETAACLHQWHEHGLTLSVYSSGSIQSQKLLYRYSSQGNLESLFSNWFDTHTGPKKSTNSYTKIAHQLNSAPGNIWFVSDNGAECDAARAAGINTLFILRDGNPDREPKDHTVIKTLHEISAFLAAEN